jgi:UDP-2,3-diacylglucosamine pyrophosphatase LpxH
METDDSAKGAIPHELVVVSDLHLGPGRDPGSPRYGTTEDFFHDAAFARFLDHLAARYGDDPSRLVLVLNGDVFDFLTVVDAPTDGEAAAAGFEVSAAERKFGLDPTELKSVYKLEAVFAGHPVFFRALARFVGTGFCVEILRGNHDLELYFDGVRHRFVELLAGFDDGPDRAAVERRVRFHQWFYLEPGRVFVEHGNQYDRTNSIRYPLRPLLPERRWWWREQPGERILDYPLGSTFVRFFYNRVRRLDPHAPRLLGFDQYLDFVRSYNLFDVWRVARDHYPHFVAALGPATTTGSGRSTEEADRRQEEEFQRREREGGGGALYRELDRLKIHPEAASKPALVRKMIAPLARRLLVLGAFAFAGVYLWLLLFRLIQSVPWVAADVFLKALLAVLTVGGVGWAWLHFDRKLRRRSNPEVRNCVECAEAIARLTGVPLVLMGHTHRVDHREVDQGRAVYANSGTWTAVSNPWSRLLRDARRMTFLHVAGDRVELARWNDDAGRVDEVPLFADEQDEEG